MADIKELTIKRIAKDFCELLDDDWSEGKKFYLSRATDFYSREISVLAEDSRFLHCLMAAGVDNWDGYSNAQDMMPEEDCGDE